MIEPENEYVKDAFEYADGVLDGSILACNYVKLACERFKKDLERDDLFLDQSAVEHFCLFNEAVPHVKGRNARKRENLKLAPWQRFIDTNVFGLKLLDGTRKYQEVYLEVPRKNGKSFRLSVLGIFMTVEEEEPGAEVYCLASTEKQAHEVFVPAQMILKMDNALRHYTQLEVNAKRIIRKSDNSQFRPLIGNPPDGSSPSCAIIDEYHEHSTNRALATMQTGMGNREEPLLVVITTAGSNIAGPCFEKREEIIDILRGQSEDESTDRIFGIIYTIDEGDENFWKTEEALIMANPNYGISVRPDRLKIQQLAAIRQIEQQNDFKTKHLNIWVHQSHPWINMDKWVQCEDEDATLEKLKHLPCIVGVDLASRIDFAAAVMVFYQWIDGWLHYYFVPTFWLSAARYRAIKDYHKWEKYITVTDTEEIDTLRVMDDLKTMLMNYKVEEMVFDRWMSVNYEQTLGNLSMTEMVQMPQTIAHFTAPMYELQGAVEAGRVHYAHNPVLSWMMGNLVAHRDTNNNVRPIRRGAEKKIDGAVAALMGVYRIDKERYDYDSQDWSKVMAV